MTTSLDSNIKLYNSVPKILISVVKSLIVLVFSSILFLHPTFETAYFNHIIFALGVIVLAVCFYHFFLAIIAIIKLKKNYLQIDQQGMTLFVNAIEYLKINWQDISKMHSLISIDKFLLETNLDLPVKKSNKYQILYITHSKKFNSNHSNVVVSAKYLHMHLVTLENILKKHLTHLTN